MKLSDGSIVPGNRGADAAEIASRIARFHAPYHARIEAELAKTASAPLVISMHSFTPAWKGRARPWELGVLWDRDGRLGAAFDGASCGGRLRRWQQRTLFRRTRKRLPLSPRYHERIAACADRNPAGFDRRYGTGARVCRAAGAYHRSGACRYGARAHSIHTTACHTGNDCHGRTHPHRTGGPQRFAASSHICADAPTCRTSI